MAQVERAARERAEDHQNAAALAAMQHELFPNPPARVVTDICKSLEYYGAARMQGPCFCPMKIDHKSELTIIADSDWDQSILLWILQAGCTVQTASSSQSRCFVLFSVRNSSYKLGCTVVAVSAQWQVEHATKCSTRYHQGQIFFLTWRFRSLLFS